MLKMYEVVLAMAGDAAGIAEQIERRDSDLARQLRRAMHSVALNLAEGMGQRPQQRRRPQATSRPSPTSCRRCRGP